MNWDVLHPLCIVYYIYWTSILKKIETKFCFVPSWLWPCIAHPIYLVEKIKMTQQLKGEKYEYPSYNWVLGLPPLQGPRRDQLVF
jgi:hypothetical protein